jgi:CHAT domain-containing protein/tetratricopeptide (TPR) repeat protein
MFGLFGGPQRRLARSFRSAYKTAMRSSDASERVAAAEKALELAPQLEPWPFDRLSRQEAVCRAHTVRGQAYWELIRHDPVRYSERALESYAHAARHMTPADGEVWAILLMNIALVYADRPQGDRGENIEQAIRMLEEALSVLDPKLHRETWLASTFNLASCYGQRAVGDRAENVERSIRAQEAALALLSPRREPLRRATVLTGLGAAYYERPAGDRAENIETAIKLMEEALIVLSPKRTPYEWAMIQGNLSNAYAGRPRGRPAENYERAIKANDLCLTVFTAEDTPSEWAAAQLNRGGLFMDRPSGDPTLNNEEAVRAFERALSVLTPQEFAYQHAVAMQNLALAKSGRIAGSKRENVESAIEDARVAAAAINRETMPVAWAQAQIALGNALAETRVGNRGERIEEAIKLYEAALAVMTPTSEPESWATVMGHLANALAERVEGDRGENIERAIRVQEEALKFIDKSVNPRSWAGAVQNLAISYGLREAGMRADNVEKQIALIETALAVVGERDYPHQHSALLEALGDAFTNRVRGSHLDNLDSALRSYEAAARARSHDENVEAWLRLEQKRLKVLFGLAAAHSKTGAGVHAGLEAGAGTRPDVDAFITNLFDSGAAVSPDDHPRTWAATRVNIGDAYMRSASSAGGSLEDLVGGMKGNAFKALEAYEAALSAVSRDNDPLLWADIKYRISKAYVLLHMCAEFQEVGPDELKKRAATDLRRGDEESARHLDSAINALEESLKVETAEGAPRSHLESAVRLGELQVMRRDWAAAEAAYASACGAADRILSMVGLSESEVKDTLKAFGEIATLAPFASLMLGRVGRALELIEAGRGRMLANALMLETLPLPAAARGELHHLQRQIAAQERRLASPRTFYRGGPLEESVRLRSRLREVVAQAEAGDAARSIGPAELIAELIADGTVVVIPVLTYYGGKIVVALRREGADESHVVNAGDEAEITLGHTFQSSIGESGRGWRDQYLAYRSGELSDDDWTATLEAASSVVGEVFAGPLMRALESLGVGPGTRLNLLPQGVLGHFPLPIARDPRSGETLLERFELSLSPSLTASRYARVRAGERPQSLASLSNPRGNLKSADFEAELAESWFASGSRRKLSGRNATLANSLEVLRGRGLWHFATHGDFDTASPLKSGLDLAGRERLNLETLFETRGLGAPRLVILSACETGLYDLGELPHEFIGLPGAFLQAGAAGVIATLWPVVDIATALLLGRFYDIYLGERASPSGALRAAQLWLRGATRDELRGAIDRWSAEGRLTPPRAAVALLELDEETAGREAAPFASPAFWGGFVHYGA